MLSKISIPSDEIVLSSAFVISLFWMAIAGQILLLNQICKTPSKPIKRFWKTLIFSFASILSRSASMSIFRSIPDVNESSEFVMLLFSSSKLICKISAELFSDCFKYLHPFFSAGKSSGSARRLVWPRENPPRLK